LTKLIAFCAAFVEIWNLIKGFLKTKKDVEIDTAVENEKNIENVINSETAGHRSKYTGRDGVFDITDENEH